MAAAVVALFLSLSAAISAAALNSLIYPLSSLKPTTNPQWLSSSQTFAFGFYDTSDGYAICIFFASFKERTVVWTANSKDPVVPDEATLLLTKDGLLLQWSNVPVPFSLIANSSQPIEAAEMLDNGNFVLYNLTGSVIWQSFDYPTDSLLPGQRLPQGGMLLSRASQMDLKTGIFRLWMQYDANLVLYYVYGLDRAIDSYYSFDTYGSGDNVSLNLDNDGRLYLFDGRAALLYLTTGRNPIVGTIYLVRLDWDGILRLYSRSKDEDADCRCLPGFGIAREGKWSRGCTSNFRVDCRDTNQSRKYEMMSILNVTWEDNYYSASRGITEEHCKQGCLEDCNCIVAFFKDGECRKQKLPLSYGKFSVNATDMAFVRVISPVPPGKKL